MRRAARIHTAGAAPGELLSQVYSVRTKERGEVVVYIPAELFSQHFGRAGAEYACLWTGRGAGADKICHAYCDRDGTNYGIDTINTGEPHL